MPSAGSQKPTSATGSSFRAAVLLVAFVLLLEIPSAGGVDGLTAKLLTYALGRGLERYDKRTVSGIVSRLPEREYRFSGLILEIVKSLPFQSRRSAGSESTP